MISLYVKTDEEEISAAFQELGPARIIDKVLLQLKGQDVLCDITGWNNEPTPSPTSALAQPITDSGDAQAILIHGGDGGVLFKPTSIHEPWNPHSPHQERRAYLVVSKECLVEKLDIVNRG